MGETDVGKDLGKGNGSLQRRQVQVPVHAGGFIEQPAALSLPDELFDAWCLLANEQVRLQRRNLAVVLELAATFVGLGGIGEHFDKDGGIHHGILRTVRESEWAANDGQVRVGEQPGRLDLDAEIGIASQASPPPWRQGQPLAWVISAYLVRHLPSRSLPALAVPAPRGRLCKPISAFLPTACGSHLPTP